MEKVYDVYGNEFYVYNFRFNLNPFLEIPLNGKTPMNPKTLVDGEIVYDDKKENKPKTLVDGEIIYDDKKENKPKTKLHRFLL